LASAAAIGVGLTSLGTTGPADTLVACAVGAALVVLWRVLRGLSDPTLRTRQALAGVFTTDAPGAVEAAWHLVRSNPPRRWMVEVLLAGEVWRAAGRAQQAWTPPDQEPRTSGSGTPGPGTSGTEFPEPGTSKPGPPDGQRSVLDPSGAGASEVAALITASRSAVTGRESSSGPSAGNPPVVEDPAGRARDLGRHVLQRAAVAARERDETPVQLPSGTPAAVLVRERLFSWRSPELRHTARGVLAAAVVGAVVASDPANPLNPTMLATSVSLLQPSLRETAGRILQRTAGTIVGVAVSLLLVGILPGSVLPVVAVLAVVLVFASLGRWMAGMYASTAVMAILLQSSTGRLDPFTGPWVYLVDLLGVIVATLVIGVLVIPGARRDPAELAVTAVVSARELIAAALAGELVGGLGAARSAALRLRRAVASTSQTADQLRTARLGRAQRRLRPELVVASEHLEGLLVDAEALGAITAAGLAGSRPRDERVADVLERAGEVFAMDRSPHPGSEPKLHEILSSPAPGLGASLLAHALALRAAAEWLTPPREQAVAGGPARAAPSPGPGRP
ncbi:MAG: FUSC family protein, partial [Janthinobacterium lividum]